MSNTEEHELSQELELLRASYGSELETLASSPELTLRFRASPYVSARENRIFVSVTATASIPTGYPDVHAKFELSESRGLDDQQIKRLDTALLKQASEAARYGELHVGPCFEAISEFLTTLNKPNPCPVCFEVVKDEAVGDEAMLGLEPCLHVLHASCYEGYSHHLAERRREKEALLVQREGPSKAARLASVKWATCPVCRAEFDVGAANEQLYVIRKGTCVSLQPVVT